MRAKSEQIGAKKDKMKNKKRTDSLSEKDAISSHRNSKARTHAPMLR